MGIRTTLRAFAGHGLSRVATQLVEQHLARHPVASAEELQELTRRLEEHRRSVEVLRTELGAIRQAIEAWQIEEDEIALADDPTDALTAAEASREALEKQGARLEATLAELADRVTRIDQQGREAVASANQARQTATSAVSTAESIAATLDEAR